MLSPIIIDVNLKLALIKTIERPSPDDNAIVLVLTSQMDKKL